MYLQKIIDHKREEVKSLKCPQDKRTRPIYDPVRSLKIKPFIAEIKRASPSLGDINTGVNVTGQAVKYTSGGAGAISILTDRTFFKGDFSLLKEVSEHVDIPLLCKDFILSEVQVEHAHAAGADFILLIAAALTAEEMKTLTAKARSLGINILYELHSADEFDKIADLEPEMVGVNSRNLESFKIDKEAAQAIITQLHGDFIKVAESGIETPEDVAAFSKAGAGAFLIGTALMKSTDPAHKLTEFYSALEAK